MSERLPATAPRYDAAPDEALALKLSRLYRDAPEKAETVRKNRETARTDILRAAVTAAHPLNLTLYLTYACNLECIMCASYKEGARQLPYEALRRIEPWLGSVTKINWVGGEVFLVDYFREALERIGREYPHIQHVIMTNGLLIDRDWARLLAQLDARLIYSVDSVVPSTYESIRKSARFEALCEALETASEAYRERHPGAFYPSALTALLMRRNARELDRFADFCARYRIGYLKFGYLHSFAVPQEDLFLRKDEEEMRLVREQVRQARKRCAEAGIGFDCACDPLLDTGAATRPAAGASSPRCYYPWTSLYIDREGAVKLDNKCAVPLGNILNDTLDDIWNGPAIQRYRRGLMSGAVEGICSRECMHGVECNDRIQVWD